MYIERVSLMRMAREVYIPFLACLLVFSGRYLTMAPGSVVSVQLLGRGWWERVRSNGGRHEHPGQMCEGCPQPEIPFGSELSSTVQTWDHYFEIWCRGKKYKQSQVPQVLLSSFYFTSFWASLIVQLVKKPAAMQETLVHFMGWEYPLEKG